MNKFELIGSKSERTSYLNYISDLTGVSFKLSELDKKNQFDNFFKSLHIKIDNEVYPDWMFFFQDDETCCMELNFKNGYLHCSYIYIWSVYEEDYLMQYHEIQSFIKNRVEEHFNMLPVTPDDADYLHSQQVEEHFKSLPVTPLYGTYPSAVQVEEHFKMLPVTPTRAGRWVEEHFKSLPVTPKAVGDFAALEVEEHFKMLPVTPKYYVTSDPYEVEEHFKKKIKSNE